MASIFDDLRDKGSGLLNDFNDFLFKDRSSNSFSGSIDTSMQEGTGIPDTRTLSQAFKEGTGFGANDPSVLRNTAPVTPVAKTNNALVPPPQDKGSNLFLGAVGDYYREAQKTWKDKGGFDALMSNPQFGIGLSLLQQASEGKTIGEAALKAMVDGGIISNTYAKKIAARGKVLAPITEDQRTEAEAALSKMNVSKPGFLDKLKNFRTNQPALYREALTKIAERAESNARKKSKEQGGQTVRPDYDKAILDLIDSGEINFRTEKLFGFIPGTVTAKPSKAELKLRGIDGAKELGGPVTKGKSYLVGEVGPEVFIPKESGKIVSNDDSKIINLLLESNPQLKNVSPARAEKILRNRFPDYFE